MSLMKLCGVLAVVAISGSAYAQQGPRRGGPPDFARMRERMEQRMKQELQVTDEQWKVLQPKIQKVQQLRRELTVGRMGAMMFGPGPGGPGGGAGFQGGPPPGGPGPDAAPGPGADRADRPDRDRADRPARADAPDQAEAPARRSDQPDAPDRRPPQPQPDRQGDNGGGPPPGGPGAGPPEQEQQSEYQDKIDDLRDALDDKDASEKDLKAKIQAVRAARAGVESKLAAAQHDLRTDLSARQEAVLITMGILD